MVTGAASLNKAATLTFDDLIGLRAEGYVRDSKPDQRDGYGPDIQRNHIQRFADSYGLVQGCRWYTEFMTGRRVEGRGEFQDFLEDARLDRFDVLLVYHTSRFGRNQEECIRYKRELSDLRKVVVFVSQGIISGSERDFINERIKETLDEAYSRNLSRFVTAGFAEKAGQGHAIGKLPLGYRNEKAPSGRGARTIPDQKSIPVLLAILGGYASGKHSFRSLAQELNAQDLRTASGKPFTESSISTTLNNRFYEGKVVYHPGRGDETVIEGAHEVPEEVRKLWLRCQEMRRSRKEPGQPSPAARPQRIYPLPASWSATVAVNPTTGSEATTKAEFSRGWCTAGTGVVSNPSRRRLTGWRRSSLDGCWHVFLWTMVGERVCWPLSPPRIQSQTTAQK